MAPVTSTFTARRPAAPATRARQSCEQVGERLLERDPGLPAGRRRSRDGSPTCAGHVGGAQPAGIDAHLHLAPSRREQQLEHLADRAPAAAADVVGLARVALVEQQPVGAHHVAHVGEVAHGVEIADLDHGGRRPCSISAIWRAKRALGEGLAAPGPGVVEGPRQHHAQPARRTVELPRARPGPPCSPRTARPAAAASSRGSAARPPPRHRTPRRCPPRAPPASGPARRTASSRCTRPSTFVRSVPPGSSHDCWTLERPARWTIGVGADVLDDGRSGGGVVEVGLDEAHPLRGRARQAAVRRDDAVDAHFRLLASQELEQVAADEAAGARDEQLHR